MAQRVALAMAVGVTAVGFPSPASAAGAATQHRTEGINVSAHSVTTRAGRVLTGITFVDEKDAPRVRRQQAAAARQQVMASGGTLYCLSAWHYIGGGATNSFWHDESGYIYADGNPNADYWNQQLLPCWKTGWVAPNGWAFLVNGAGWFINFDPPQGDPQYAAATPPDTPEPEFTRQAQAVVCDYDGNWTWISGYGGWASIGPFRWVVATQGPLTGSGLWKVISTLGNYPC
jgi:hypothetical protein